MPGMLSETRNKISFTTKLAHEDLKGVFGRLQGFSLAMAELLLRGVGLAGGFAFTILLAQLNNVLMKVHVHMSLMMPGRLKWRIYVSRTKQKDTACMYTLPWRHRYGRSGKRQCP
eukprot:1160087-Pelagomonas_calceolata.AAC.4